MENDGTAFKREVRTFWLRHAGRAIAYGFGCAYVGRDRTDGEQAARDVALLETAYSCGFRYFDTSANYGDSEAIVGKWLPSVPRGTVFVATKAKRFPADAHPAEAAQAVKESLQRSLERLRAGRIDLYQLHDIDTLDQATAAGGVLEALLDCKRQGLVRYIGVATRSLPLLTQAARLGAFDTVLTYADLTPLAQPAEPYVRRFRELGAGAINASPLAGNLITGQDPRAIRLPPGDSRQERLKLAIAYYDWCRERGVAPLAHALQFPLRYADIDITLTGPATAEQLRSTLACLEPANDRLRNVDWHPNQTMDE
ncbi:aldo/keto reductase [Paenibacillus cymbidii]|uniref:aldo/keto reductase n=1 Tax=Paenibacillus cymbidii TaxID=1639034 RepID=UPI0010808F31|nr:aldo/keto reductase [Paenibacillus cymbidii]